MRIYLASLGAPAGLALAKLLAPEMRVVCFTPMDSVALRLPKLLAEANAAAKLLGIPERLEAGDLTMHDETIGAGYGTHGGGHGRPAPRRPPGRDSARPGVHGEGHGRLDRPHPAGWSGGTTRWSSYTTGGLPALFAYNGELTA